VITGCCNDSTARRLRILVEAGQYRCLWAVSQQAFGGTKSCVVTAGEIRLVTGADSIVTLARSGDTLHGTFVVKGGRSFSITLARVR
jgi:hypothetical protein